MKSNRKPIVVRAFAIRSVAWAALVTAAMLAGCGGDGESDPGPTAEGAYGGTLTNATYNSFRTLILDTGEYWTLYGEETGDGFQLAGFVQGTGTSDNGSFSSANAKDFGGDPPIAGSVSASYDATAKTISGTLSFPAGSLAFSGGPLPAAQYVYETPALLARIEGIWSMTGVNGDAVDVTISTTGALAGSSLGCAFTGTAIPRATGKNVFDLALKFGTVVCSPAGGEAKGIAVAYTLANGQTQLIITAVDAGRSFGAAAFGVR